MRKLFLRTISFKFKFYFSTLTTVTKNLADKSVLKRERRTGRIFSKILHIKVLLNYSHGIGQIYFLKVKINIRCPSVEVYKVSPY
jgi:hypothetical protein